MSKKYKGINRDPKTLDSLRKCFYKYLRTDLTPEQKKTIEELVELMVDISKSEFECKSCKTKLQLYGFDITKIIF